MISSSLRAIGVLSIGFALGACGGDSDKPTEADYDDVAQALGGVVATGSGGGEVGSFVDATAIAAGVPTLGITVNAAGQFVGNRLGLSYDYGVACLDSVGAALDRCGATTDAAQVDVAWSGDLTTPILTAAVTREGSFELTAMQSGTAVLNGTSALDIDARFDSLFRQASRVYHVSYDATYEDVQVRLLPAGVIGGRVDYALDVERMAQSARGESSASFEIDAVLVFGTDGSATLTLDGELSYAIDPLTGRAAKRAAASGK